MTGHLITKKNTIGIKKAYKLNFVSRYVRLVLWLFGVSVQYDAFIELGRRIDSMKRDSGVKFTTLYLKEALRLVQHWKSGNPTTCLLTGPRVASRRGLPLIIPGQVRLLMENNCSRTVRVVLTLISIFRIFKYPSEPKLGTITSPFKGISESLNPVEVQRVWELFSPFVPKRVPKGRTELIPLKTAGPNFKKSILGAPLDAYAWHNASEVLRSSFKTLSLYFNSSLAEKLDEEIEIVKDLCPVRVPILGKLSLKAEAAGKVRVFAIVDVWTQSVLEPLHEYIYSVLRNIPQDGTFNQSRPLDILRRRLKEDTKVFSFDLSAATDRLPIGVQIQVMAKLCNAELALAWSKLLTERVYWLKDEGYRYAIGQPMGALSSFGMLALTHHLLVQYAAFRIGRKAWFNMYALLGDDIVIADEAVAVSYHYVMTEYLGVDINMSKSLVSSCGVMEFAKRLVSPKEEFTPLGPKNIASALKHPANIPMLLTDLIGKGDLGNWNEKKVADKLAELHSDILRISRGGKEALLWSIIGPFGFIDSLGVSPTEDETSLEEVQSFTLIRSIEETLLYYYSKEWESAFDKTIVAALGVIRQTTYDKFVECPSPHIFPSYRNLTLRALESIVETGSKRPLKTLGLAEWFDDQMDGFYMSVDAVKELVAMVPTISPLDNPWTKPKLAKPKIRRLGVDFFKKVALNAKRLGREEWY